MRKQLLGICTLLVCLALPAFGDDCSPPKSVGQFSVLGVDTDTFCTSSFCRPGNLMELYLATALANPNIPRCTVPVTWNFGDGTPEETSPDTTVRHAFATSGLLTITGTLTTTAGPQTVSRRVFFMWGRIYGPQQPPLAHEEAGVVSIRVWRTDTTHAATVDYTAGPADQVQPISGTLSFAEGETEKMVDVPLVNDARWQNEKEAWLKISHATGGYVLEYASETEHDIRIPFQIIDDDEPTLLRCSPGGDTIVNEAAGSTAVVLERTGNTSVPSFASVQLGDGGYNPPWTEPTRYAFAAGETRKTVSVSIDDGNYTGTRTGKVFCSGSMPNENSSSGGNYPLQILDDEPFPTLSPRQITVREGDVSHDITVGLMASPPFGFASAFEVSTLTSCYPFASTERNTLTFTPGAPSIPMGLTIYGNKTPNADQQCTIRLHNALFDQSFVIKVLDDDSGEPEKRHGMRH